jgi:hypothetical protein
MAGPIRIRALQVLADLIQSCVPELKGHVCGGASENPHRLEFPSLGIYGIRFTFNPDQQEFVRKLGATRALFNIGRVEGTVQMRLGASSVRQRYELEEKILENVFWRDIDRPGIVLVAIPECNDTQVAFELDGSTWEDEKAFDRKWYSIITTRLQLPVLVTSSPIYDIAEVRLTMTEDLTTPIATVPALEQETVSIDELGGFTLVI